MNTNNHVTILPTLAGSPEWKQSPVNNVSKNWFNYFTLPYATQEEYTHSGCWFLDNCTVISAIETIQGILNYYIKNNDDAVSDFIKKNYLNPQGYVQLSVRYNSVMAGIVQGVGANIGNVWNSFNVYGFVPQTLCPELTGNFTWEEYYTPIDPKIISFGQNSTKLFKIVWNVIANNGWLAPNLPSIEQGLLTSPISFASQIGNIDINGIEQPTTFDTYQHCRCIGNIDSFIEVLDNYPIGGTMLRKLNTTFPIPCGIICQILII